MIVGGSSITFLLPNDKRSMCAQTQVSVCRVVRFKFRRITIMNDASSMEKQQLIDIRRSLYLLWQFFFLFSRRRRLRLAHISYPLHIVRRQQTPLCSSFATSIRSIIREILLRFNSFLHVNRLHSINVYPSNTTENQYSHIHPVEQLPTCALINAIWSTVSQWQIASKTIILSSIHVQRLHASSFIAFDERF